jgi:hypothetical protein
MMFSVEAQILGECGFFLTQFFIGEFSDGSTVLANHESVAALCGI